MDVTAVVIVAIVFGSILIGLMIIANLLARVLGSRGGSRLSEQETQVMQEIFYGLKKMEERIDSLETILLDKDRRNRES